jgi:DNA primase catalytic core
MSISNRISIATERTRRPSAYAQLVNGGDDDVRRVIEATDIVRVIGESVQLKPKGREFVCLCPFHDDNNPSCYVVPGKQMFHCFVCGAGGDALTFVKRYHGLSFPDALKMLADLAGIELTRKQRRDPKPGADNADGAHSTVGRDTIKAVNTAAMGFFQRILTHPEHGERARAVIDRRGISPEMVDRFCLGASPDRWDGLLLYAHQQNIPEAHLLAAGLAKARTNESGCYDALRNRLIFPILGESGEPIAFGARRIDDDDEPKYLNSPETALFHKSNTLYGLHQARDAIRKEGFVAVVEGYTDVIACHQHGIENVVGTLGTALTAEHARRLRWKCDRAVLLFDGDEAGQRAADRAFEVLFSGELDVSVVVLSEVTDAKDPDELLAREGGREQLVEALRSGKDLVEMHFGRLRARAAGKGAAGARRLAEDEVRKLWDAGMDKMPPQARTSLVARMAEAAGVRFEVLTQALDGARRPRPRPDGGGDPSAQPSQGAAPEPTGGPGKVWLELVACVLAEGEAGAVLVEAAEAGLRPEIAGIDAELCAVVLDAARAGGAGGASLPAVLADLPTDAHRGRAARFVRRIESMLDVPDETTNRADAVGAHARDCLARLRAWSDLGGVGPGSDAGGAEVTVTERLERLRRAHGDHGSNPGARFWKG